MQPDLTLLPTTSSQKGHVYSNVLTLLFLKPPPGWRGCDVALPFVADVAPARPALSGPAWLALAWLFPGCVVSGPACSRRVASGPVIVTRRVGVGPTCSRRFASCAVSVAISCRTASMISCCRSCLMRSRRRSKRSYGDNTETFQDVSNDGDDDDDDDDDDDEEEEEEDDDADADDSE